MKAEVYNVTKELFRSGNEELLRYFQNDILNMEYISSQGLKLESNYKGDDRELEALYEVIDGRIDECKDPVRIMELVDYKYKEKWFEICLPYFSKTERSRIIRELHLKNIELIKTSDKRILMSKDEYNVYVNLPDTVALYGNDSIGWYRSKKKAVAHAILSGGTKLYKTEIPKEDVHCYFNGYGQSEYIITPGKLRFIRYKYDGPVKMSGNLTEEEKERLKQLEEDVINPEDER